MNILYIHQYFTTPEEPGGTRSYWISKELIKRGHNVTVITSTNKNNPDECVKNIDGIKVAYVKNAYDNYMSIPQKLYSFANFIRLALKTAKKQKNIDLIYATSTPLTIGYIALRLKKIKGWPYVFEVRDLWPEFPIQIGAIKNKIAINYLKDWEKKIYHQSEHIVALSPGMKDGVLATDIPDNKCSMIPNMSKPDEFFPREKSVEIMKKFNIESEKFNVIHFGSMGRANGLGYIIETANCLKDKGDNTINFLFMGDGATQPIIKKQAEEYGLNNVKFLGNHKMSVVSEVVNCCDASITSFLDLPILYTNSPNKLFDSLSAGKPIIVNSAGWTKDLVEKENCGFYVDPNNPNDFAEKLLKYKDDLEQLKIWGKNSRRLSLEVFDKNILSSKVADVIECAYNKINNNHV